MPQACTAVIYLAILLVGIQYPGAKARILRQDEPPDVKFYVFGYGSLLLKESRAKTNCDIGFLSESTIAGLEQVQKAANVSVASCDSQDVRPLRIRGIRRAFNAPGTRYPGTEGPAWSGSAFGRLPTFLGATLEDGKAFTCTGVIYTVSKQEYDRQIEREKLAGYIVTDVRPDAITFLDGKPPPKNARITFFASNTKVAKTPSAVAPIVMSYVDVWLGGALQLQRQYKLAGPGYKNKYGYESFTAETILTTYDWSPHWLNDRLLPLRPWIHFPDATVVDQLLLKHVKAEVLQGISFPR